MTALKIISAVWLSLCVLFCTLQAIKTAKDRQYIIFVAVVFGACLLYVVLS